MNLDIERYLNSGMLEAYVIGAATPEEEREVLRFKENYPEVKNALLQLELDMENMAAVMAIPPPPGAWNKIDSAIDDIILREQKSPKLFIETERETFTPKEEAPRYIDASIQDSHMRVHKSWKWVLAAVFILGKIFLATAIYFYLENRQAQEQIQQLKIEVKALK